MAENRRWSGFPRRLAAGGGVWHLPSPQHRGEGGAWAGEGAEVGSSIPTSGSRSSSCAGCPEQRNYELIRPLVLFGDPVAERAEEVRVAERTLYRRVSRFENEGMQSLFDSGTARRRRLPPSLRGCYELDQERLRNAENGDRWGLGQPEKTAFLCGFLPSS